MFVPRYLCIFSVWWSFLQSSHIPHQCQKGRCKQQQGQHVISSCNWRVRGMCIVCRQWYCSWHNSCIHLSDIPFLLSFLKNWPRRVVTPLVYSLLDASYEVYAWYEYIFWPSVTLLTGFPYINKDTQNKLNPNVLGLLFKSLNLNGGEKSPTYIFHMRTKVK